MERLLLLDRIRRAPVLCGLPLDALDRLVSRSRLRRFRPGSLLIEEGSRGDEVFVLVTGRVAVRMRLSGEEQRVMALREAGDWVGEMALLEDLPRSASVTAETAVQALRIPKDAFLEVVTSHAPAAVDLLRTVSARLRESDAERIAALRDKNRDLGESNRRLRRENHRLHGELDERFGFESFIGSSRVAERVRAAARRAAQSELPVLLLGETGAGKELIARAIHAASERRVHSFVAVNCGLLNETLLESELFGHARGAFTGATAPKPGLVEEADGGTLFLDEIADMPWPVQAALLRFIELGEFRRLGESRVRHATGRVIASTHVDLDDAVAAGRFRRDLYYRLDVVRLQLPPLRERAEDLPELARHCIGSVAERLGSSPLELECEALEALCAYDFPGNFRELLNEIERLYAIHGPGAGIRLADLSLKIHHRDPAQAGGYAQAVRAFKTQLVEQALDQTQGNRAQAAERLGVHRSNLVRMIRDLGIDPPAGSRNGRGGIV